MSSLIKKIPTQFKVLLTTFVFLILLINFWRLYFLFNHFSEIEFSKIFLYLRSFLVGFRLDCVVAVYILLPIFITIFFPVIGWFSKIYRQIMLYYIGIVFCVISFLGIIDVDFYDGFGTHLNLLAFQQNTFQKETIRFIWDNYHIIWYVILFFIVSGVWIFFFTKIIINFNFYNAKFWQNGVAFLTSFILLGTGVRGGWQERPIDWGHAMFSQDVLANQTALNNMFLLGRSIIQLSSDKNLINSLTFYDKQEAFTTTKNLINDSSIIFSNERSINRRLINPTELEFTPNVVLVILESHIAEFCGHINSSMEAVTPNLDNLAHNGITFTRCIANGKRSAHGMSAILCSWPVIPGYPLISQVESQGNIQTIGSLLKGVGYETTFLYGGDADFDNMKGFLLANGFQKIIEQKDFPAFTPGTTWGVWDHFLFDKALEVLDESKQPVLLTMFSVTNHEPWIVPKEYENKIPLFQDQGYNHGKTHRTMAYVDHVIGDFISKAEKRDWYEQTIFVFISDHGLLIHKTGFEDPRNAHIPFVIFAPGIIEKPQIIEQVVSQVDVLPTIFSLIGYQDEFNFLGRNVLSKGTGFACRVVNDEFFWLTDNFLYYEVLNQSQKLYRIDNINQFPHDELGNENPEFGIIQKDFRSYLQTSYLLFKGK